MNIFTCLAVILGGYAMYCFIAVPIFVELCDNVVNDRLQIDTPSSARTLAFVAIACLIGTLLPMIAILATIDSIADAFSVKKELKDD